MTLKTNYLVCDTSRLPDTNQLGGRGLAPSALLTRTQSGHGWHHAS
jgi:hypothetical protein